MDTETPSLSTTTNESFFHLTLQRLHQTGHLDESLLKNAERCYFLLDCNVDEDASDTTNETTTAVGDFNQPPATTHLDENVLSKFWLEAHTLSCLENSSFESSVQQTLKNVLSSSSLVVVNERYGNQNLKRLDFVKKLFARDDACAYIDDDGEIRKPSGGDDQYKFAVICPPGISSITSMNTNQLETVARITLSSRHTDFSEFGTASKSSTEIQSRAISDPKNNSEKESRGWFQYSTSLAKKLTWGVNSAVDSLLNYYDGSGGDIFASTNYGGIEASELDEIDDAKCNLYINDENADDNLLLRQGKMIFPVTDVDEPDSFGISDSLVSLSTVSLACRRILDASMKDMSQYNSDMVNIDDYFFLNNRTGGMVCIVLHKHGFNCGSFGSYCRRAGEQFFSKVTQHSTTASSHSIARVLSNISESEVNLLALTFKQSGHAIIDENIIFLFPRGVPSNFELSKHNHALFQIHSTKLTIQNRMTRLEKDADGVKNDAIRAKQKGLTAVAMVHMKRRKALLEELDRCATILTNLDSSKIRLERAKTDVQYIESFSLLKEALKDIRTKNEGMRVDNVEDLMEDIREEMNATNSLWNEMGHASVGLDEVELEKEFKKLQLDYRALDSNSVQDEEGTSPRISEGAGIVEANNGSSASNKTEELMI